MKKRLPIRFSISSFWVWAGLALGVFLAWFLIRFFTIDTELVVNTKYDFPNSASTKGLFETNTGDFAVAIDGKVVGGNNFETGETIVRPTASTAKMILGLAVMSKKPFLENEFGETIIITDEMYEKYLWYLKNGGSYSRVVVGGEISEYDALASVFLVSSNNMADSLAIWAFGSIEAYREYATEMLKQWGLNSTTIGDDASGFSDTTTSTAEELAIIGTKVMAEPVLAKIVATKSYEVPMAGELENTNQILGELGISGIKTGYIGDTSGYCLVSGYRQDNHIVTVSLLGAPTRQSSFNDSLAIVKAIQDATHAINLVKKDQVVGYYESWWTGKIAIRATEDYDEMLWQEAETNGELEMMGDIGTLNLTVGMSTYKIAVAADTYNPKPNFFERIMRIFGWEKGGELDTSNKTQTLIQNEEQPEADNSEEQPENSEAQPSEVTNEFNSVTSIPSDNCTIKYGYLMLINPNFTVSTDFIDARRNELISLSQTYGIREGNAYNGDNLLDAEAAKHLNEMVKAYEAAYPGHTFETFSCYRARGTTCGRLCAATGTSDHHTGLTCDLVDPAYGISLDTDTYDQHIDWQWLYANSYKYGFIDRFPVEWAGGPMSEPVNVDENGSTGLFETWHYRYVGVGPATEIATGKYNNGNYDSLEHYLKARGLISDLKAGTCN